MEKSAKRPDTALNGGGLFQYDAKISLGKATPLGLQHVVAAIVGIITPAMIIADTCKLSPADKTILIQVALVMSGLATLLQLFPIGPIGARLPVIIGTSFAYIPTLKAIGEQFDIATIFGAQIAGGVAAFLVGLFVKQIRKFFPPVITGTVIFTIGLSLYPTAIRYMAGGGSPDTNPNFGSWQNWLVAAVTLAVVIFINHFTKGIIKLASILLGMGVGYALALSMNMVNFSNVGTSGWFQLVSPLHFGVKFVPSAIISLVIMFIVNAVQAIGDFSSTTLGGMDREPTTKELSGGIMASGIVSVVGSVFGSLPTATYSQNVGIVTVTRVVNRIVFAFAAVVLLVAGLVPKFAAILTTIPQPVIGGATISVFATITMTGIRMISSEKLTPRVLTVVGLSVALGVGITSVPSALVGFPTWVPTIFASSSVVMATVAAILFNLILPKDSEDAPAGKGEKAKKAAK